MTRGRVLKILMCIICFKIASLVWFQVHGNYGRDVKPYNLGTEKRSKHENYQKTFGNLLDILKMYGASDGMTTSLNISRIKERMGADEKIRFNRKGMRFKKHVTQPAPATPPGGDTNVSRQLINSKWTSDRGFINVRGMEKQLRNGKLVSYDALRELLHKNVKDGKKRPNVLFIIADDMRPDIGIYNVLSTSHGSPWLNQKMYTPNLDRLAARSMLFTRAYSQIAWCNPSRSSFLTSRRPDTTMVHNNSVFFRQNNPGFVTLPQYFRNNGYFTASVGKVFHRLGYRNDDDGNISWSMKSYSARNHEVFTERTNLWKAVTDDELNGLHLVDQLTAAKTIQVLADLASTPAKKQRPFFLAMGLRKPHVPFVFPERFLDFYPKENTSVPANPLASSRMPPIAWFASSEFRGNPQCRPYVNHWSPSEPLPTHLLKTLRRAYYASISYIDELIGSVLDKLEASDFLNDTIIAFIGDHGFHLGEQSILGKNTVFEVAANSPMMISVPGVSDGGMVTDKLVELVDIYPTLVELAGFPKPPYCPPNNSRPVDMCTEGSSMVPLFEEALGYPTKWKESVFYQYPHYHGRRKQICMGYSIRNAKYRYTEWINYSSKITSGPENNMTELCGVELYDHQHDPHETYNRADFDAFRQVQEELSDKLHRGWSHALPTPLY